MLEEGPALEPGTVAPFSIEELARSYRHRGLLRHAGLPPVAYAEGRCVGGSTEVNSGLWNRLPDRSRRALAGGASLGEFTPDVLDGYADRVEGWLGVGAVPGGLPQCSAVLDAAPQPSAGATRSSPRVQLRRARAGHQADDVAHRTLHAPPPQGRRCSPG